MKFFLCALLLFLATGSVSCGEDDQATLADVFNGGIGELLNFIATIDDKVNFETLRTKLHLAVLERNVAAVGRLLQYGASAGCRDFSNRTPLDYAFADENGRSCPEIIAEIIEYVDCELVTLEDPITFLSTLDPRLHDDKGITLFKYAVDTDSNAVAEVVVQRCSSRFFDEKRTYNIDSDCEEVVRQAREENAETLRRNLTLLLGHDFVNYFETLD